MFVALVWKVEMQRCSRMRVLLETELIFYKTTLNTDECVCVYLDVQVVGTL